MGVTSPELRAPVLPRVLPRVIGAVLLGLCLALAGACGAEDAAPLKIVASTARVPFHRSSCNRVRRIPGDKWIEFEDRDSALEAGHQPCVMCKP